MAEVGTSTGICLQRRRTSMPLRWLPLRATCLGRISSCCAAFIESNWDTQTAGEKEGYKNRASASACGKGILRSALRNLSRFYARLDRLEERGDRPQDVWPLIGNLNLKPVVYPPEANRWRRAGWKNQARGPVFRHAA
jgi:hypothetical protein